MFPSFLPSKMLLRSLRICKFPPTTTNLRISLGSCREYKCFARGSAKCSNLSTKFIDRTTVCRSKFHTTQKLDIPPALTFLIRPLVNVAAFLFGRYFKRWWARQTPAQKEMYKKWIASKRGIFLGVLGAFFSGLGVYYVSHLETDPVTKRRRLIILNDKQQALLADMTYEMNLESVKDKIVSHNHPAFKRIMAVTKKLLEANADLPFVADGSWTLDVLDIEGENAYVLPGGHIFVFLDFLKLMENDDQLAIILAHEIAHVLLKHAIEKISYGVILDILLIIPLAALWAMFPDLLAFFIQGLAKSVLEIFLHLPYSRAVEKEADAVGLDLAAKACVDVREAVVFWAMMKSLGEMGGRSADLPIISTHPNHEEREKLLVSRMPKALELRMQAGCPTIPRRDPRTRKRSIEEQAHFFKLRGYTLNAKS